MASVTIDGKQYETDDLSEDARKQLQNVVACDRKLQELRTEAAMVQTARNSYARSLSELISSEEA